MSFTDSGYAWQTPDDSSSDERAKAFIVKSILAGVYTFRLVQVSAVHPNTTEGDAPPMAGTVDVQILVNQIDGATPPNSQAHGIVFGLPYFRLRFGGWEVSGDPAVGDIGLAAVCDRDISAVKATQAQANPGSLRRFSISDGIYLGGVLCGAPTSWVWLKSDGTLNFTDGEGNSLVTSSAGFVFTGNVKVIGTLEATKIQTDDAGLNVTGSLTATLDITAGFGTPDAVGLQTHTHVQPVDSHGDTEAPTASPTPGT